MGDQNRRIRLYGLSTCPECRRLKKFLDEKNVTYELIEVDLLDSGEQWVMSKEIKKYNPAATYPTLVIEQVILGFDEQAVTEAIEGR